MFHKDIYAAVWLLSIDGWVFFRLTVSSYTNQNKDLRHDYIHMLFLNLGYPNILVLYFRNDVHTMKETSVHWLTQKFCLEGGGKEGKSFWKYIKLFAS